MRRTPARASRSRPCSSTCSSVALPKTPKKRPDDISGFMLYSMARRYDEWAEDDDTKDSGSSLRGALKGWAKHGASRHKLWPDLEMPDATNEPATDWWLDAVKRPLGAYYRIAPENVRDMHVALSEVGAIYASAFTHDGWDMLLTTRARVRRRAAHDARRFPTARARTTKVTRSQSSATRIRFNREKPAGPRMGPRRLRRAPVRGLAAQRHGLLGRAVGVATIEHDAVSKRRRCAWNGARAATWPSCRVTRRWPIMRSRRSSSTWRTKAF